MLKRTLACIIALTLISAGFVFASGQSESDAEGTETQESEQVTITVWDHFQPLEEAHEAVMARIEERRPNVEFEHEIYNPADMPEALQLAFNSDQLPDITTNITGGIPTRRLIEQGWYIPIDDYVDVRQREVVNNNLFEGRTVFNGDIYSVPIFNRRWSLNTWYNADLLERAGVDPESDLQTYSDVLDASQRIRENTEGDNYGMVLPIQFTARMTDMVNEFAEAAGAPGEIDWRTGEYQYGTDPYVEAIEFMLSFQENNSLYPGSTSIDARNARARWANGTIGLFSDGPWNPGVLQGSYEEALDFTEAAWIPVPDTDRSGLGTVYVPPAQGEFFLTNDSDNPEEAAQFFLGLTTDQYYRDLARGMDQPPLDMSVIDEVDVHPSYANAIEMYRENVLVQPEPQAANPEVAQVIAEMRDVHPNLGEIVQGVFSGAITDIRGALEEYNRKMTEERNRAIEAVQEDGVDVSVDDWVFPNWDPNSDFTPDMY